MTNETTTMTNETMEMVADNSDMVIEAAEAIVEGNDIDLTKFGKGLGLAVLAVGGGYLLVTKGIPAIKKFLKKEEVVTVEPASDYKEAIDETDVEVEVESEE